jgi:hypothetical protein
MINALRYGPIVAFAAATGSTAVRVAAVDVAGIAKPCRIYDMRSTFASNALAAGVTVFELARVMGTSVGMIEHHYGALIDGAHAGIVGRLDALELAMRTPVSQAPLTR